MHGILYEETSIWTFLFVTVVLGGWAAWMTGKAAAQTWRKPVVLIIYMLLLGVAVRFIHFSVFEGTLLALRYYLTDTVVLIIIALLSYRYHMAAQMAARYWWLYEKTGPFSWRERPTPLTEKPAGAPSR